MAAGASGAAAATARGLLRGMTAPQRLSDGERRGAAVALIKDFAAFARDFCGCVATSNRAHLRRAVFNIGRDLNLESFISERLGGDTSTLEVVARMACPVTLPDRTMLGVRVPESAPKRIVFASKALRRQLTLTETQTCRGCLKRQRCRFFKAPAQEEETAGVQHISRVLFGMAQYARAHLQQPEAYPFYFSSEELTAARALMVGIGEHVTESGELLHHDIEIADKETARRLGKRMERRKLARQQQALEERVLALPQWMRETLRPVPGPGMTKRQHLLLRDGARLDESDSRDGTSEAVAQTSSTSDASRGRAEWVEEGEVPGEPAGPLLLDPVPAGPAARAGGDAKETVTVVDGVGDVSTPRRFEHVTPRWEERKINRSDSAASRASDGTDAKNLRVDLDALEGIEREGLGSFLDVEAASSELRGGYTIADMLNADAFDRVPDEVLQYVSVSPRALEGVQEYRVSTTPKLLNPEVLEDLWRRTDAGEAELPFLKRIPFDVGVRRSGGALPPQRLPREMLVDFPEPVVPPPERTSSSETLMGREHESGNAPHSGTSQDPLVMLDTPTVEERTSFDDETLAADEDLVSRVFAARAEDRRHAAFSGAAQPAVRDSAPASDEHSDRRGPDEAEDFRFAAWSGRPRTRSVSVLEPSVDFGTLSDPNRLDQVGMLDEETDAPLRQRAPLPKDDNFASTFRRPLNSPPDDDGDPLGVASPGIDIEAIKAGRRASASMDNAVEASGGLEQDSSYIFGGSLKFPKLPASPAMSETRGSRKASLKEPVATQRLPPRMGRLRQAKLEDLSDLVRPAGGRNKDADPAHGSFGSLGHLSHPESAKGVMQPPLSPDESREQQNAAIVAQSLLHKRLTSSIRQRFPDRGLRGGAAGAARRSGGGPRDDGGKGR